MQRIILLSVLSIAYLIAWIKKDLLGKLFLEKETEQLLHMLNRGDVNTFSSKRMTKGLIVGGVSLVSFIMNQTVIVWLGLFIGSIVMIKWPEIALKKLYQSKKSQLKIEFPIWLRQLQILLQHNTVVQSLKLSYSHAPVLFKVALNELVIELEKTPQDLMLYTSFLQEYQSIEVQRAMKLLYRYNAIGSEDATRQLSRLIQVTTKWLRDQRTSTHDSSLSAVGWWGMLPLIGVSGLFLVMMVQTIMTILERR